MENKKEDVLEEKRSRRSRKSDVEKSSGSSNLPYIGIAAAAVILTLGAGIGFYFAKSGAYRETFMPNTTINGLDVAGKGVEEVKAMIEEELVGYELKILDRTGAGAVLTKEDVGLRTEFEGGLEQILSIQEPMMWIKSLWTETDYRISTMLVCDEELLKECIEVLPFMDEAKMEEPEDAYLSEYQYDTNSYEIVAQTEGTELVKDAVLSAVHQAVLNLEEEVDLDTAGCYTKASVLEDDAKLTTLATNLNRYAGASVTHRFGEIEEVLDGDEIHQWLTVDGTAVTLDESKITAYIRALAKKYNTAYGKRPFLTTYGDIVTIPGGSYGWRMNETKEAEAVLEAVKEGAVRTREPEWLQTGASHGEYDYGDTYVEVNLTGQHLFFYKDGELLVECDFVSGNASKGWSTPAGIYPLNYKERNATLRGENYATPVSYWMPFNGGIGLHDADWRANFGGAIYKTNGSHGCVNLPPAAAKLIYENISKGDPIVCYQLDGTGTKKTTKASEINTSGVPSVGPGADASGAAGSAGTSSAASGTQNGASAAKPGGQNAAVQETKPAVPETAPAETPAATTVTPPTETSAAQPEVQAPIETYPVQPEVQAPTETAPSQPETQAPTASGPSSLPLTPETGGIITETRPAGPGAETNASGTEPGSGPGGDGNTAAGPGSTAGSPAYGPGAQSESTGAPTGPGSDFVMPETADAPTAS